LSYAYGTRRDSEGVPMFRKPQHVLLALVSIGLLSLTALPGVISGQAQVPQSTAHSSPTVYITKTGKCYHSGSCQYLKKSCIPVSLEEAVRLGKVPCSVCKPPTLEDAEE
jgi:hypothetical protein